ncbi:glycosyltransferase family 2 protein [Variovorax sp. PAMC26660]|uniref:glycosyltransferase family 2 protein n=1 Tax=Variovorax sp. PAMC26660 TaxID=2762322 RepID=UPI00164DA983|nr:glycosyltransferase family 2 protein [Variovorax sp. PAMC26660]QNK67681.1 glycosyltransferase family 2 protein [Variovorax sp. PAMC26660]
MSYPSGDKDASCRSTLEVPFSFGAVVVTYFPTDAQVANLHALAGSCARLCVVDNTPQAGDWHRALADAGIHVLHNGNRGGIAGAFNGGIVELEARGAELFFLLDQDSKLPPGYFAAMCEAAMAARNRESEGKEDAAFLIGPLVHDTNLDALIPQFGLKDKRVYQFDLRQPFTEPLVRCAFLISSGSLISRAAWARVGRFDERYVIDHVDTDYCMRALRRDVPLYLNPHVVLRHQIGQIEARSLFGWKIHFINYPAARRYYIARNALDLSRAHVRAFPAILFINVYTLKQILPMLMFERDRWRKSIALMVGFVDGLLGRLGGLSEVHPRVGKYLSRSDRATGRGTTSANS